jgi:hypothetical protein
MNSDLYDSAAWRTFDMLDADESSIFDEAMRHDPVLQSAYFEMDRLSAAIAAALTTPIEPQTRQLERLQSRLGLHASKRAHIAMAVSGWAAALVLGVLLVLHLTGLIDSWGTPAPVTVSPSPHPPTVAPLAGLNHPDRDADTNPVDPRAEEPLPVGGVAIKEPEVKAATKVETKRLNQEIEVLRAHLTKVQHRDRVLFEVVPGMALPIVMTLNPPGVALEDPATLAKNEEHSSITTLLGDALTSLTGAPRASASNPSTAQPADPDSFSKRPSAIPIYDAARDLGTMVVSNLPPAADGEAYNLWVTTEIDGVPIYVGSLPENCALGVDSFDFSLGSTLVLPCGFVLTRDPEDAPATPTEMNTILLGPPVPAP